MSEPHRTWRDRLKDATDGCDGCGDLSGCDLPGCDGCGCDSPCMILWLPFLGLPMTLRAMPTPTLPAKLGLRAIRGYQRGISAHTPARCRYEPSCSSYAAQAVNRYGLKAGTQLAAARIRSCRRDVPRGTADPLP
jgi:putative membrane protein insertion efficiency factor